MSGVHRLLTRKDKKQSTKTLPDQGPFGGVFELADHKKPDKDEEKKIKTIQGRLQSYGITHIADANIAYALDMRSVAGNMEEAFKVCMLLEDTYEGLVKPYDPDTKLLGAVNREGVTCYLDALLFAMFARLDSFEAMLYNSLEEASRKRLASLLRLWVNMLRTGRLITTDITMLLQAALAECGWAGAANLQQQDTSEAFSFITDQLELPLLTLKMDLFHIGKEDPNDDHKFINERLLEVAILTEPAEGESAVTLEQCLENYFNNRIEVKRHMERQRRNTLQSKSSADPIVQLKADPFEKSAAMHVETVEFAEGSESPIAESPIKSQLDKLRPTHTRKRADSIFSQRRIQAEEAAKANNPSTPGDHQRKGSLRTEVLMPAWQFFKLLPWYTDNVPTNDAQVAAHFAQKRPVLGICLKRYMMDMRGNASRLDTYVDIPVEIALPDFVSDDNMDEDAASVGNFKLILQSVVCHRGRSTHSGHYVSMVRGDAPNAAPGDANRGTDEDPWMLFDDMARQRVTYIDIKKALREECPYLLFYQVQPITEEPIIEGLPSYNEATSRTGSTPSALHEKVPLPEYADNDPMALDPMSSPISTDERASDAVDWATSTRSSVDAGTTLDDLRGRTSTSSDRRGSITFDESSIAGSVRTDQATSVPTTPLDDSRTGFLQLPSRRGSRHTTSKKSKSRPTSQGPDVSNRFSLSMSRITSRMSRTDGSAQAVIPSLGSESSVESIPEAGKDTKDDESVTPTRHEFPASSTSAPSSTPALVTVTDEKTKAGIGRKEIKMEKDRRKDREKEKGKQGDQHGHHHHGRLKKGGAKGDVPDRDCVVM